MTILSRLPMWDHKKAVNPLDVTVKSSKKLGRYFAPTWAMVMGHKSGVMPDEVYVTKYVEKLTKLYWPPILEELGKSEHITFLCYCKGNTFCHTYLLMDYLVKHFGDNFKKLS
ncbi:hypothetical protein KAR91_74230 [Candidatus Pacearchaeota archaeon]|nr:hypothetical protein [Candidatus Pacearchaeota archaeon]